MWLRTSNSRTAELGLAGTTVGNYRLLRELGHGSLGTVFEAQHERIGRRTAVKVLRGPFGADPALGQRALTEAQALSLIEHPGIVSIYDCTQVDGVGSAIVMELLRGESLADRLGRLGRLPWPRAARIALRIAAALGAADAHGIAHLDLKPANVMLVPDVEAMDGERVKVMDFGLAQMLIGTDREGVVRDTGVELLLGSPRYMAPEQCKGGCPVDGRADVYALGVILYEMLAGRPPFDATGRGEMLALHILGQVPRLEGHATGAPQGLVDLIHGMLAKDPADRPALSEVEQKLQSIILEDIPTPAPVIPSEPMVAPVEAAAEKVEARQAKPAARPVEVEVKQEEPEAKPIEAEAKPIEPEAKPVELAAKPVEPAATPLQPEVSAIEDASAFIEEERDDWDAETEVSFRQAPDREPDPILSFDGNASEWPGLVDPDDHVEPEPGLGETVSDTKSPWKPGQQPESTAKPSAAAGAALATLADPPPNLSLPESFSRDPDSSALGFPSVRRRKQREAPILLVSTLLVLAVLGIVYTYSSLTEHPKTTTSATAGVR